MTWGVTWPLLENDGAPLTRSGSDRTESVRYPGGTDQQNFIAIDARPVLTPDKPVRSTYGDLRPIRVTVSGKENRTLIYPKGAGDPDEEAVRKSFVMTARGFRSIAGHVFGDTYVGLHSAGGFGKQIDTNGDGVSDVTFSEPCGFLIQLRGGKPIAIEVDRAVQADVNGRKLKLARHSPLGQDCLQQAHCTGQ